VALAGAALGLGLAGAGISAIGTLNAGEAQQKASAYQAQVATNNATIANQNAEYATQAGQSAAAQQGAKNRSLMGQIVSGQAANNIDVNTGSAVDVQATARETGQLNAEQTVQNAALQNYGYRTQATGFQAQAGLETATANEAVPAAELSASGGLLSSASSLGSQWTKLSTAGALGS
jgi:hypothetical protein